MLCISHTKVTVVSNSDLFTLKRQSNGANEQNPKKRNKNKSRGWKIDALKEIKATVVFQPEGKNEE